MIFFDIVFEKCCEEHRKMVSLIDGFFDIVFSPSNITIFPWKTTLALGFRIITFAIFALCQPTQNSLFHLSFQKSIVESFCIRQPEQELQHHYTSICRTPSNSSSLFPLADFYLSFNSTLMLSYLCITKYIFFLKSNKLCGDWNHGFLNRGPTP